MTYPHQRRTRTRPHPTRYGTQIREATCVICGRWYRIPQMGTITCGPVCRDEAKRIRRDRVQERLGAMLLSLALAAAPAHAQVQDEPEVLPASAAPGECGPVPPQVRPLEGRGYAFDPALSRVLELYGERSVRLAWPPCAVRLECETSGLASGGIGALEPVDTPLEGEWVELALALPALQVRCRSCNAVGCSVLSPDVLEVRERPRGDCNGDAKVDVRDVVCLQTLLFANP